MGRHRRPRDVDSERKWSLDDRILVEQMLLAKKTYRDISLAIFGDDKHRNAIAGFIKRSNLVGVAANKNSSWKFRRKPKPQPQQPIMIKKPLPPPPPPPVAKAVDMIDTKPVADLLKLFPFAVSFDDLDDYHCHWPVQDHPRMFCGATAVIKGQYCRFHRENGRVEPRPPRNRAKIAIKTWR